MPKAKTDKTTGTQLLDRAISILNHLGDAGADGARMSELADACSLNASTAHRIISSLENHGLIERIAGTRRVRLGLALFALGAKAADGTGFRRACHPSLLRIAAETGDMVFLMARSGFNTVCVDRQEGAYVIETLTGQVGGQIPLGVGSAGQAILAFLPEAEAEAIIAANATAYKAFNQLSADDVLARIKEIRELGYALDHGQLIEGISALAMPIRLNDASIAGALTINMTSARLKPKRLEGLLELLQREIAVIRGLINPYEVRAAKPQARPAG
ncbi:IclR family transcriptional regulator [Pseudohoeflea coraliihabitans]|uniref:IclR family transcriptional regulator n=1 Tax=Pseudohoeflea coraliihabitans TaxID=2860393 RepID=A0ABS6WLH0_9HYPH|nr:IclR family transcriptional regulator [Pseudohoeflea sp. DP4N28-3]MBW3096267.1 IclR family transcriptional regulator [Pseudohoeflea sp. DP4N28-3]